MKNPKKSIRTVFDCSHELNTVLRARHAELKRFHNGIAGFAKIIGKNPTTVGSQFNPSQPSNPTLEMFISSLILCPGDATMSVLCDLNNGHFVPNDIVYKEGGIGSLLSLISEAAKTIDDCADALEDGQITHSERLTIDKQLSKLKERICKARSALWKDL